MAEGSKTEKATPKKRRDERKKGNVFLSQDAVAVATLLASFMTFWLMAGRIAEELTGFMQLCVSYCASKEAAGTLLRDLMMQGLLLLAKTVLPITLATALAAIVATFAQTRLLVRAKRLLPEGFLQMRTLDTNYEELRNEYFQRRNHRLSEEWVDTFCRWVETLPYAAELICYEGNEERR